MLNNDALFDEKNYITAPNLADRFVVPPISLLDARKGEWAARKKRWAGIVNWQTDEARSHVTTWSRQDATDPVSLKMLSMTSQAASMFDPVLAEISYTWWCPLNGVVIDPFAGGNVRGMIAGHCGYHYYGVDLSKDQVVTNREQLEIATPPPIKKPSWENADSSRYTWEGIEGDFIFSCPPYGTLERYSEDPADLSTMKISEFEKPYKKAIANAMNALKNDRFAAFVVGNYREDKKLVDLVSLTVEAFGEAGGAYYGDLLYITPYGTTPLRAASMFNASRKIARTHQYLLVFVKGDPFVAAKEIENAKHN